MVSLKKISKMIEKMTIDQNIIISRLKYNVNYYILYYYLIKSIKIKYKFHKIEKIIYLF